MPDKRHATVSNHQNRMTAMTDNQLLMTIDTRQSATSILNDRRNRQHQTTHNMFKFKSTSINKHKQQIATMAIPPADGQKSIFYAVFSFFLSRIYLKLASMFLFLHIWTYMLLLDIYSKTKKDLYIQRISLLVVLA
jgi:hypothetical protein